MSNSIAGKTAIVTGAANGIGLAIARHFLDQGANVMIADIDEEGLEAEFGAEAQGEGSLRMFTGDLREKLTIANLLSATVDAFNRIDILVNASRQVGLTEKPLIVGEDGVEAMLQQNLITSLRMSQMTAKRMIAQAAAEGRSCDGTIVNLTSIAGQRVLSDLMGYSIACAALDQMTRSLAAVLAPKGIRVNGVAVASVMSASLQAALKDHPDWRDRIEGATPLGRIASSAEVAETVRFLSSDASSFITGQILPVDGGRSILDPASIPAH